MKRNYWKSFCLAAAIFTAVGGSALGYGSESGFSDRSGCNALINSYMQGLAETDEGNVEFARLNAGSIVIELQHVEGENDAWYLHLHDISSKRDKMPLTDLTIFQKSNKDNSFILTPLTDVPDLGTMWKDNNDQWYKVPYQIIHTMAQSPKGWQLKATKPNGKTYKNDINDLTEMVVSLDMNPNVSVSYGPMYSTFFPEQSAEDVKKAFIYHLAGESSSPHWITDFCVGDGTDHMEYYENRGDMVNMAYVAFRHMDKGTWVDVDFWQESCTVRNTQYGPSVTTYLFPRTKDYFLNSTIDVINNAYNDMEEHPDYGIALSGGHSKNNPKVESVDVENHPELKAVTPGDWILSINGVDVTGKNYYVHYALSYAPANNPLHIKFKNDKSGEYELDVTPIMKPRDKAEDFDYTKDYKGKEIKVRVGVPYEANRVILEKEVFNPYASTNNHLISPRFHELAKAIGVIEK